MTCKQNKFPTVSVCVITYNHESHIGQCLQSILDQKTDFKFEVIVGDDASTDSTRDILEDFAAKYPDIIRPIYRTENVGTNANYLEVHTAARGKYVAHCDGDDFWLPGKLSYQYQVMERNPTLSQCWTCANLCDNSGQRIGTFPSWLARSIYPKIVTARMVASSYALVGQHSTQMYRRDFYTPDIRAGEVTLDFWLAFLLATKGPAYYSKKKLSSYRMTESPSITRSKTRTRATVDILSRHLSDIIRNYSEYAGAAKANLVVRRFFSRIRNHDTTAIDKSIEENGDIRADWKYVLSSFLFFTAQKFNFKR